MAPTSRLIERVARRFQAAVVLRDEHETDEMIATCSPGCSVGTWEVLQLLVTRGIAPNEIKFTSQPAENVTSFEAATKTGTVTGTVTIKTKHTPERIDAYAEVTLDADAEDGKPVPAAGVVHYMLDEIKSIAAWIEADPEAVDAAAVIDRLLRITDEVQRLGW